MWHPGRLAVNQDKVPVVLRNNDSNCCRKTVGWRRLWVHLWALRRVCRKDFISGVVVAAPLSHTNLFRFVLLFVRPAELEAAVVFCFLSSSSRPGPPRGLRLNWGSRLRQNIDTLVCLQAVHGCRGRGKTCPTYDLDVGAAQCYLQAAPL